MNPSGPQIVHINCPVLCPNCAKEVVVGLEYEVPRIVSVSTSKQCDKAKFQVRESAKDLPMTPEERAGFEAWLSSPDTLITLADVEMCVANLRARHPVPESAKEK